MKKPLNILRVFIPNSNREEEEEDTLPPNLRTTYRAPHTAHESQPQRSKLFFITSPLGGRRSKAWGSRGHATWDGAQLYATTEHQHSHDNDLSVPSSPPISPSQSSSSPTPTAHNTHLHHSSTPSASTATPANPTKCSNHSFNHTEDENNGNDMKEYPRRLSSRNSSSKHLYSRSVNDVETILGEAVDRNDEDLSFYENSEFTESSFHEDNCVREGYSPVNTNSRKSHVASPMIRIALDNNTGHRRTTSVVNNSPQLESKSFNTSHNNSFLSRNSSPQLRSSDSLTIDDINHPEDFPPERSTSIGELDSECYSSSDNCDCVQDANDNDKQPRRRSKNARYRSLSQQAGDGPDGPMTMMLNACYDGDVDAVKKMLEKTPLEHRSKLLEARDTSSFGTPLHKAAASDQSDVVQLLISYGANIEAEDALESRPLHWAAANGSINAVKTLALYNAQMNVRDKYGYSPLHLSLKNNFLDVTEQLTRFRADINLKRPDGSTAMHLAAGDGDLKQVRFLIQNGALANSRDSAGNTPLFRAVANGHLKVFEELIHADQTSSKRLSIRTDGTPQKLLSRNNNGENILHICARNGTADIMKRAVVRMGPQTLEMLLNEGEKRWEWTPLHLAVVYNQVGCTRVMLFIACNPNKRDRNGSIN